MPDLSTTEKLVKYVEDCPEIALFMLIDSLGGIAWRLRHDAYRDGGRGHISPEQADEMDAGAGTVYARVEKIVPFVKRFGVDPVLVTKYSDFHKKEITVPSDDYWRWYKWWKSYVTSLSDEQFRQVDDSLCRESDVSAFRPSDAWRAPSQPLSTDDLPKVPCASSSPNPTTSPAIPNPQGSPS